MSDLTSRFREDGKEYFESDMTSEEMIIATSMSSSGQVQTLARRIAEQADEIERMDAALARIEAGDGSPRMIAAGARLRGGRGE